MKKFISLMTATAMVAGVITGCGADASTQDTQETASVEEALEQGAAESTEETSADVTEVSDTNDDGKLSIVTTIFPEYDWVKTIVGDNAENVDITMLLDNGVDLHSYQPTAEDIMKIATCDMFVYVGGESDEWVEDALAEATNENMVVVDLLDVLGESVKEEEIVEGMEAEEHDHDHSAEVSTFEDDEVEDRTLEDWAGEWQSPYQYLLDGELDEAFEAMAEEKGDMTAEEYKEYYKTGYESDIVSVKIEGDNIEFTYENGDVVNSDYEYVGYFIQDWSSGTRAAMYRFEAVDKEAGAPIYIEINDHMIAPHAAEHFHIRMSDESFDAIVDPETYWPTFFPADMSAQDISDHLSGKDEHDEEAEEATEETADADEHEHEEGEVEYDEHVWLSLKNTEVLCTEIEAQLETIDPDNAETYKANLDSYVAELDALDAQYQETVDAASVKTLLFGDRFPFRYLVDDYGLDYYAAFVGCSAETEASFETIIFLADKVNELGLNAVMTIEGNDHTIAETVRDNTESKDQEILTLDSMQSTTSEDVANGASYLSIMTDNLEVLKSALQ